jgi:hypothetical protein
MFLSVLFSRIDFFGGIKALVRYLLLSLVWNRAITLTVDDFGFNERVLQLISRSPPEASNVSTGATHLNNVCCADRKACCH